jgi:uncharacterized membrane protein
MDDNEYRERLAHDVAGWMRGGLITAEQERAILARIGAGEPRAVGILRLGWFVTAISIVGALVLAGGVTLLFASQWNELPTWFRTASIIAGMLASYAAGYALIYRFEMQRVGSALFLLGVLLYEAALFLLPQIYNMPVDDSPIPFLLAAIGTLPLAYLFDSRIVLLIGIANFTGWAIMEMVQRYPDSPETQAALLIIAALGVAYYAIGHLHEMRMATRVFADTYAIAGLLVVLGLIYVFSFDEPWSEFIDAGVKSYAAPWEVYAAIALAGVLVAAQAWLQPREIESGIDVAAQAVVLGIAAIVATWPAWTGYAVLFNGIYFAIAIGIVTRGYLRGDERYINLGLAVVGLGLITRYVDVFWSILANSAFFIIGGLLLLAVAFAIERMRRGLIRSMGAPHDDAGAGAPRGLPA